MSQQPWATGPGEILQHGLSLLKADSDNNRRLALLSIDNAVELTIKTYLSLPRRVSGISLSRKDYLEISESFPRLLDAIEQHASDKLSGIDLGDIEWYHRLRNELYHQGNGLTVERKKVEVYAELAKLLFRSLFGVDVEVKESESNQLLGDFLAAWAKFEGRLSAIPDKLRGATRFKGTPTTVIRELVELKLIDIKTAQEIEELRQIRNGVVHGREDSIKELTQNHIERVSVISKKLEEIRLDG